MLRYISTVLVAVLASSLPANAQWWDFPYVASEAVTRESGHKFTLTFEQRIRLENRTNGSFGADVDHATGLLRTRVGVSVKPLSWLKFSGMLQDSRSPGYGSAVTTMRNPAGLQEAYMELTPGPWAIEVGRAMMTYGEGLIIGTPQWGNTSRSYDHARVAYKLHAARFEFLVVSPVKLRADEFARPVLGDRAWGTYNTLPDIWKKTKVEFYVLRHDQNRPGGFTGGSARLGTDRLETNSFGGRWSGPALRNSRFSLEAIAQNGTIGGADHRATAFHATFVRRFNIGRRPLDLYGEYNYASGTRNPSNTTRVSTFDQVFSAHHDRFGHQDLFGWRNLHALRSLNTLGVTRRINLNLMFDDYWLASVKDGLYNGAGRSIARSASGTAGRHVGEELDVFATCKLRHSTIGLGYGRLFTGEFLKKTTPGHSQDYFYIFHGYSF